MYNILLTDDEQIVINTLSLILSRNFAEETKIFSALSGVKAIEIIRQEKIDVVFMDIHMPGINGLETINLIKQINPNIVIVILSAYDQFQYAQQAMNFGAFKYLTKPVNRNLIVQTVRDCMSMVDSKRGALSNNIQFYEKLNFVSSIVESDFIYSCIFNESATDYATYLEYFDIVGLPFFMMCIEYDRVEQNSRYDIYMKTRDILTSKGKCVIGSFMANKIGVFFSVSQEQIKNKNQTRIEFSEEVREMIKSIYLILSTNVTSKVRIGISLIETDIQKSSIQYKNALAALSTVELNGGFAFYGDSSKDKCGDERIKNSQLLLKKIENRLKIPDMSSVNQFTVEYIDILYQIYSDQESLLKTKLLEFIFEIRFWTEQLVPEYQNKSFDNLFSFISQTGDKSIIIQFVKERIIECVFAISLQKESKENPVIQKACDYIEKNISMDIGLEQVAEYLNLSTFYLSKLFKDEKGCNFITYVTDLRLEKAKKLLVDSSLIIKEIAQNVGYNDQNYFSKAFKQKYGLSPSEFRDSLGER